MSLFPDEDILTKEISHGKVLQIVCVLQRRLLPSTASDTGSGVSQIGLQRQYDTNPTNLASLPYCATSNFRLARACSLIQKDNLYDLKTSEFIYS